MIWDYPDGVLSVITRVLLRGKQEGQKEKV